MSHAARTTVSLSVVLAWPIGTMVIGAASKARAPAAGGMTSASTGCSAGDIVPLLNTEQLHGSRLPFLDPCQAGTANCDEYPVVTMLRDAAGGVRLGQRVRAVLLGQRPDPHRLRRRDGGDAVRGERIEHSTRSRRPCAIYGTVNWDLVAVLRAAGLALPPS